MSDTATVTWAAQDAERHAAQENYWRSIANTANSPQVRARAQEHVREEQAAIRNDAAIMSRGGISL